MKDQPRSQTIPPSTPARAVAIDPAFTLRLLVRVLTLASLALFLVARAYSQTAGKPASREPVPEINTRGPGAAAKGYDVVAYFTDHAPVKGSPDISYQWRGATWYFATSAHRDAFKAAPEKYAPQYGGYCSFAISLGSIVDISPKQWRIVNDKLYLNNNPVAQSLWSKDPGAHIVKGDANWNVTPKKPL